MDINRTKGIQFEERGLSSERPIVSHEFQFDQDSQIRMHYHSSLEINLCRQSEGLLHVEGSILDLSENPLIVLQPRTLHSYRIKGNGAKIKVWHIGLQYLPYIDHQMLAEHLRSGFPYLLTFSDFDPSIDTHLEQSKTSDGLRRSSLIFSVLERLFNDEGRSRSLPSKDPFLHKIREFSEKSFQDDIGLDDAASSVNLSRYHFCRKFREKTGSTYNQYLTNLRLENSVICLNEGCTVTESAFRSGYGDISYFIKKFKKEYGMTPGDYLSRRHLNRETP